MLEIRGFEVEEAKRLVVYFENNDVGVKRYFAPNFDAACFVRCTLASLKHS